MEEHEHEHDTGPRLQGQIGVVVGAGSELGAAMARELGAGQMRVALVDRAADTLASVLRGHVPPAADVRAFECDPTAEDDVEALLDAVEAAWGVPDLVVAVPGLATRAHLLDLDAASFERSWRAGCLAAFVVGRAAARRMVGRGSGTIVLTGSSAPPSSELGATEAITLEGFGLPALAQALARELGPHGIHVAHLDIEGEMVSPEHRERAEREVPGALLAPRAIARTVLHLHQQHRSAWTHELDLRPWVEPL